MTIDKLRELARHAAHRTAPAEFSVASVDKALADGFKQFTSSINDFMKNRYDIYDIIIENADEIVPAKVMDQFGQFAEVRNVAQGDKVVFKRGPLGRARAKKFLTQVGLSGVYETFRLDNETYEVGDYRIKVIPSIHSKPTLINNDLGQTIDAPLRQPAKLRNYKEGGSYDFYVEAETRDQRRMDVVVDYAGERFVIELKIWRGESYNEQGEEQLSEYLDYFGLECGYLVSFCFTKDKKVGVREVSVGSRTIVEAVV